MNLLCPSLVTILITMPTYQGSYRANKKHHTFRPRALNPAQKVRSSTDNLSKPTVASTVLSEIPGDHHMTSYEVSQSILLTDEEANVNHRGIS